MNALGSCTATKDCLCPPGAHVNYKLCGASGVMIGGVFGMLCSCCTKPIEVSTLISLGSAAAGGASGLALIAAGTSCYHLIRNDDTVRQPSIGSRLITQQPGMPSIISHAPVITVELTEISGKKGPTIKITV